MSPENLSKCVLDLSCKLKEANLALSSVREKILLRLKHSLLPKYKVSLREDMNLLQKYL